jgi:hypothetical protein
MELYDATLTEKSLPAKANSRPASFFLHECIP